MNERKKDSSVRAKINQIIENCLVGSDPGASWSKMLDELEALFTETQTEASHSNPLLTKTPSLATYVPLYAQDFSAQVATAWTQLDKTKYQSQKTKLRAWDF
jgi:hypothetical protein